MGIVGSKEYVGRRKMDIATSNSSLSNLRYVMASDKSKWKMFRKKEPSPTYPVVLKPLKGCPCGNDGKCKQKITPKGVTIHYPQKKKKKLCKFPSRQPLKSERLYSNSIRPSTKVKVIRQRKFPTWGLDKLYR